TASGNAGIATITATSTVNTGALDSITITVRPPKPPDDPLVKAIRDAYNSEMDSDKAQLKSWLAALYRQSAKDTFLAGETTWGKLFTDMMAAAKNLGISGKLPLVQKVIQVKLKAKLPSKPDVVLDQAGRTLASTTFNRIVSALELVTKTSYRSK